MPPEVGIAQMAGQERNPTFVVSARCVLHSQRDGEAPARRICARANDGDLGLACYYSDAPEPLLTKRTRKIESVGDSGSCC